jgi:GT2 family glycosyltransferase
MADVAVPAEEATPALAALAAESLRIAPAPPVTVSIVIVTWNSARWIERCIRSLPAASSGIGHEILVHDNASADGTLSVVEAIDGEDHERLTVIRSPRNDGLAAATNRAIARSSGRYILLLNPDCEFAPGALATLVDFLDRNRSAAVAAPLLVDESGDSQRDFQLRRLPTLGTLASEILLLDRLIPSNRTRARYRYRDLDLTEPQRIEQPAGAALLLRRELFDEIGLLDEQFAPAWFEDVDFFRRLAAAGRSAWVVPAAVATHFGGSSLEQMSFADFNDIWYRNMWRYARKWMTARQSGTLRWVVIAGMLARCIAASIGLGRRDVRRGDAIRAYARVLKQAYRRWTIA